MHGSRAYGLARPGSDTDLKGLMTECDLTLHEADKALRLLLGGNGNMLERILSPLQLYTSDVQAELQQFARDALSRRFGRHYRGFFSGMCREHSIASQPGVKSLLYSYRVALTGVHLLRSGELEANINRLAPEYGFADVLELVAYKREHAEKSALPAELDQAHRSRWPELEAMLEAGIEDSPLPPEPPNRQALSDWLVRQRLKDLN